MTHIQRLNNLNEALIKWARIDAGFSEEEIAVYCGLKDASVVSSVEAGITKLTTLQAEKLTKKVNRPLAFFYLGEIPQELNRQTPDNRSPQNAENFGPKSLLAIRRMYSIQDTAVELQGELSIIGPTLPLVYRSQSPRIVAGTLIKYLRIADLPRILPKETALELLIQKVEAKGIIVTRLSMPRDQLQGASIYKPLPIIIINHSDYRASQIFTLMHELTHLCLRSGGTCLIETEPTRELEQFCNQVAGEILVPHKELILKLGSRSPQDDKVLSDIAEYFSVSREVVLLRLIQCGRVPGTIWDQKVPGWRREIAAAAANNFVRSATPVNKAIRENGHQFTQLISKGVDRGVIAQSEASRYLNVRGGILQDVLGRA